MQGCVPPRRIQAEFERRERRREDEDKERRRIQGVVIGNGQREGKEKQPRRGNGRTPRKMRTPLDAVNEQRFRNEDLEQKDEFKIKQRCGKIIHIGTSLHTAASFRLQAEDLFLSYHNDEALSRCNFFHISCHGNGIPRIYATKSSSCASKHPCPQKAPRPAPWHRHAATSDMPPAVFLKCGHGQLLCRLGRSPFRRKGRGFFAARDRIRRLTF